MKCWLLGHRPLKLEIFSGAPFITLGDAGGNLVKVNLCVRCKLLYWEVSNALSQTGLRATKQQDSICWH